MSRVNWLWGAPRIYGELLKLGIEVVQSTVAKYMVERARRPGQIWATFVRNHAAGIAANGLFVVPMIGFKLLYCLVCRAHGRRQLVHHAVNGASNGRMGCATDDRGLSVGHSAQISGARSRRRLWLGREATPACA
jgi:hypothetical protein